MDAAYTKKTAVVVLDRSEVRLIVRALVCLRYSTATAGMNGSQLADLAGLSHEWLCMTQDIESQKMERISKERDINDVMSKTVSALYGPGCSWEVY